MSADQTGRNGGRIHLLETMKPALRTRAWMTAVHPRLPIVATSSTDKSVRLYSLATFEEVGVISGAHTRSIRSCAWKPTSGLPGQASVLTAGSFDSTVSIWRRPERNRQPGGDDDDTADGLATGRIRGHSHGRDSDCDDGNQEEEDEDEWQYAVMLEGHESEIKSVGWNSSGQYLATCSRDKSVWIWEDMSYNDDSYADDDTFEVVAVLQKHGGDIKTVSWHPTDDLLASGSYDDTIALYREDLDDWVVAASLSGHQGTIWGLSWEGADAVASARLDRFAAGLEYHAAVSDDDRAAYLSDKNRAGPRLASCSDDKSVRLWQRQPQEVEPDYPYASSSIPSSIRAQSAEEEWHEVAQLPQVHTRSVYSVAWSHVSGLVATTGSDGMIVVYAERWTRVRAGEQPADDYPVVMPTEWVEVGRTYDAHGVFEINHITWARRRDRGGKENEEVLVTTGDDGHVRVWRLDLEHLDR